MTNELVLIGGSSNPELNQKIADELGVKLASVKIDKFGDTERYFRALESVRDKDVYVIQSTCPPVNDNLMELLIMLDALKRASAKKITVVMPYMGYSRQERMATPREPISTSLVARLIQMAGANHVVLCDIHAAPTRGFFTIPTEHVDPVPIFAEEFKKLGVKDFVVVSPDAGAMRKNKALADRLGADFAVMLKRRNLKARDIVADTMVVGDVEGKNVVIIDDSISAAGTLCASIPALKKSGAKDIYFMATHPILIGKSIENIQKTPLTGVFVGDTIPLTPEKRIPQIKSVSFSKVFAGVIKRLHEGESVNGYLDSL
ncbi:ribose-phosphate pyrophosphokinase [Candidatus Woesearchaeota archaeon]|nr:ribose-phosphate pyrophosphokinase [Candidatus Woesearchaeota archaeon]